MKTWCCSLAIGGFKLQVMESDVETARSVMEGMPAPAGAPEEENRAEENEEIFNDFHDRGVWL